ncbi:hypothetical protein DIURU_005744 [Diutina rugosa]|uniref:Protein PBN1 n=1 Tax=Diutina rugosa TaxID=5481 RepID=A0A642UCP3_DIURU|nr:uncharacterized protein DIURU_005744 [Diutina rugosa]KAA8896732.1 hypothetical protein DIURU_005744 [Diutina rugosa]
MNLIVVWWTLLALVAANTETIVFRVPYYYDIPPPTTRQGQTTNATHTVIHHYPIDTLSNQADSHRIALNPGTTWVQINNYDGVFEANDVINVKFCWPATNPYHVKLDHVFSSEFTDTPGRVDLFVAITLTPEGQSARQLPPQPLTADFYIAKLPSARIPIPVELYPLIPYLVAVAVTAGAAVPFVYRWMFSTPPK